MKNEPYVKQFDENGTLTNPINGVYQNEFPNRKERRGHKNRQRFISNKKGVSLTITKLLNKVYKYKRVLQIVKHGDGSIQRVEHYIEQ